MGKFQRRRGQHPLKTDSPPTRRVGAARVPGSLEPAFLEAEDYVSRYFSARSTDPENGRISISGERYILLRAASMSVEFFDVVTLLYQDRGPDEARLVASNLLFDVAHALGKADAKAFHDKMDGPDPIKKLSTGPIHFAFTGWAFVNILPESHLTADDDYLMVYEHVHSFETDAWLRHGRKTPFPVCIMNAGYSSGWCEESFGIPLVAVEIECVAMGGRRCRFIMAPVSRIEEHIAHLVGSSPACPSGATGSTARPSASFTIPEFFQRKRLEDELRKSHEGLESRIAQRTSELVATNDRLRQEIAERIRAEQSRDEFISLAAHELKTPLTGLRGFAQLLLRQIDKNVTIDQPMLKRSLQAIHQQSEKLSRLVSQLLDVSRLEGGQLRLERAMTDVTVLIQSVASDARASTTRHTIFVDAPSSVMLPVDPLRLEQVLTNVLDNAIKYSPEGGPITVDVSEADDWVQITVTDRGIGVPPEHRARVFDRFYQVDPRPDRLGGMGLGLYISRQIVELHGGRLEMEFPEEGGTRVRIHLPRGERAPRLHEEQAP